MKKLFSIFLVILPFLSMAQFAPPAGQEGSTAINADSSVFVNWATGCSIERGLRRIDKPNLGYASYGSEEDALGKADDTLVVSLGDGGVAVLTFASPIINGEGPDFAVFENPLKWEVDTNLYFLELAFVEVSSDGENYVRFSAVTNIPETPQVTSFQCTDPKLIHNFAGKYSPHFGTPFDLEELPDTAILDKNNITHVRIIDVVGTIKPEYATYDSQGHIVNDPWPTPFESSGFDLDAVGVIHDLAHLNVPTIYHLTLTCNPDEGKVEGEGDFAEGTTVAFEAIPNTGYRFKSWNDGVTENPRTVTMTSDLSFVALFEGTEVDECNSAALSVYPNPVHDLLTIQGIDIQSVNIYSIDGQLLISTWENAINVSDLPSGMYLVRVVSDDRWVVTKFLKQ